MMDCFWCGSLLNQAGACTSCASIFPVFPDIMRLIPEGDQECTDRPTSQQSEDT
jgi:hypothetical protein